MWKGSSLLLVLLPGLLLVVLLNVVWGWWTSHWAASLPL